MNPFDLPGITFFWFYIPAFLGALLVAYVVRNVLRRPADPPMEPMEQLHPYEVAYLRGAEEGAATTVLAHFSKEGFLDVHDGQAMLIQPDVSLRHPLEKEFLEALNENTHPCPDQVGVSVVSLKDKRWLKVFASPLATVRERLTRPGFLLSSQQSWEAVIFPVLVVWAVISLGGVRMIMGLSRGKPVGLLVMALFVSAFISLLYLRRPYRSRRGDILLDRLREKSSALEASATRNAEGLSGADLAMAVGLFGVGAVSLGVLSEINRAVFPPVSSGGDGGSSCGGSGGGGCGGGCGGCGGD